jgi:hypothetical protein
MSFTQLAIIENKTTRSPCHQQGLHLFNIHNPFRWNILQATPLDGIFLQTSTTRKPIRKSNLAAKSPQGEGRGKLVL